MSARAAHRARQQGKTANCHRHSHEPSHEELHRENERLLRENEELRRKVAEGEEQIAEREMQIADLERQLAGRKRNSTNSSKPPSSDGLTTEGEPRRHEVTEVPAVKAHITEYQFPSVVCGDCGKATRAPFPEEIRGDF